MRKTTVAAVVSSAVAASVAVAVPSVAGTAFAASIVAASTVPSVAASTVSSLAASTVPSGAAPLDADAARHVVLVEYEAWFGPKAVTFQHAEAMPVLQSPDMQQVGGGYDSADPHVIAHHVRWLESMGVDGATVDLTNNVGCIFSSGPVSPRFCNPATEAFRRSNRIIRDDTGNLYPAWTSLGTGLKLVPLLGCQNERDLAKDADGRSGLEKEVDYFGSLIARFPARAVLSEGKPLMLLYVGTPVPLGIVARAKRVLHETGLDARYTIRVTGGYLDSQPTFWAQPGPPNGPIEIAPQYGFWSVVDRFKPAFALYPTYNALPAPQHGVENLTVSLATAGQRGWGCPAPKRYCPEDALRFGDTASRYVTLAHFMDVAEALAPRFLIVDQFNEFAQPDEGWNAQTSDDAEPTQLPQGWGETAIDAVRAAIAHYRLVVGATAR